MAAHTPDAYGQAILWKEEDAGAMGLTDGIDSNSIGEHEFLTVYEQTARPILAYLTGVAGRRDVAADLLQETYCRYLVRQPKGMDANETRRYLFRIATNLLHDRWRRKEEAQLPEARSEIESSAAWHGASVEVEGPSGNVEMQLDVRRTMRTLKPRERELLWLAYVEGMNHQEIAAATGLSAISIRLLLFRARRKAASLLRPRGETI